MHADFFRDIAQHHRFHRLIAMLQEFGLTGDNTRCNLEQRLVANLEAAYQPARFLQL